MPSASSPAGNAPKEHLSRPISEFISPGPPPLRVDQTVGRALDAIRATGLAERIFYFYVVDAEGRLSGVVPARKLLTEPLGSLISDALDQRSAGLSGERIAA